MKTYTLEEIKDMVEKAEGSDWAIEAGKKNDELYIQSNDHGRVCRLWNGRTKRDGNAKFIAASRTIVPQLVGQLEKAIEALRFYAAIDDGYEVKKGNISVAKEILRELGFPVLEDWLKGWGNQSRIKAKLKELGVEC